MKNTLVLAAVLAVAPMAVFANDMQETTAVDTTMETTAAEEMNQAAAMEQQEPAAEAAAETMATEEAKPSFMANIMNKFKSMTASEETEEVSAESAN